MVRIGTFALQSLLALLAGVGLWLAFPDFNFWWLYPIALGGFFALLALRARDTGITRSEQNDKKPKLYPHSRLIAVSGSTWIGFVFGLGFFIPLVHWTGTYTGLWLPWFALAIAEAVFFAFFAFCADLLLQKPSALNNLAIAALWTGFEYLRSNYPFGGFPWGAAGFSQVDSPLLRLAPFGGLALVAFTCALLATILANLWLALVQRSPRWQIIVAPLLAFCLTLVIAFVPGLSNRDLGVFQVASVQGNVTENGLEMGLYPGEVLERHARVHQELPAGKYQLVVWPENSSDLDPELNTWISHLITESVTKVNTPVLVGTPHIVGKYRYNESQLWLPGESGKQEVYRKQKPVPFGEYIPARDIFSRITDLTQLVPMDMLPGDKVASFKIDGVLVGDLICFEIAYEESVAQAVAAGNSILVVQSNNAPFGHTAQSAQQLAQSRFFAAMAHRSVVHSSTVGISAIIDPNGQILTSLGHWQEGWLGAAAPLADDITWAVWIGPWGYLAALLIGLCVMVLNLISANRSGGSVKR